MSFYIKFQNGFSVGNPSPLENLQQLYENFLDNAQTLGYYPVEIINPPSLSSLQPTYGSFPQYTLEEDNTVVMSYVTRKLNAQEKQVKYNNMLEIGPHHTGWTLDPDTLFWEPPIAMPDDGNLYIWSNVEENWVIQSTE
jgi:hypothetical protein